MLGNDNLGSKMLQHGPWRIHARREVYRDPWLTLTVDEVTRPDGSPGTFCVAEILHGVSVLALDADFSVHLTEEFRYAIGRDSLEVVSGGRDPGEEALAAAQRELREELGIEAGVWTDLGSVDPFTSMLRSPTRLFLAEQLSFGKPTREGTEEIRSVKLPLATAVQAVLHGRITHAPSCVLILNTALRQSLT
jgi:ADP-ribose pyrophosphatase